MDSLLVDSPLMVSFNWRSGGYCLSLPVFVGAVSVLVVITIFRFAAR